MSEKLATKKVLFQIQFLSMHVCKATIWDYKIDAIGILEFFPEFWEKKFPKNDRVFWEKLQIFVVLPKFQKNLVQKDSNQHNLTRYVEIRAPGGRESLWTTGEKFDFHCEVQNQPNLIFSFWGL